LTLIYENPYEICVSFLFRITCDNFNRLPFWKALLWEMTVTKS